MAKLDPKTLEEAISLRLLATCVFKRGRLEEAEKLLRRCLAIAEARLGPEDMQVTTAMHQMASTLHQLDECGFEEGRREKVEELLRRCLAIEEATLGTEDVQVAKTLHELGSRVMEAGRLEEASGLLERSLSIKEANLRPDHVHVGTVLLELAACYLMLGRVEESETLSWRGRAIQERHKGEVRKVGSEHPENSLKPCLFTSHYVHCVLTYIHVVSIGEYLTRDYCLTSPQHLSTTAVSGGLVLFIC